MKIKAIVSMIALAATGAANATINYQSFADAPAFVDTFITVFNANASFTYNLGLDAASLSTAQTTPLTFNISNDSNWASFLSKAGSAPLSWSVQAFDTDTNTEWTTAKIGQDSKVATTTGSNRNNAGLETTIGQVNLGFLGNVNQQGTLVGRPDGAPGSVVGVAGTNTYWSYDYQAYTGFTSVSNLVNAGSASLFTFTDNIDDPYNQTAKYAWSSIPNKAALTSSNGVYTLTISAPSAVPEPEGVALALVGLVGLVGVSAVRRRSV